MDCMSLGECAKVFDKEEAINDIWAGSFRIEQASSTNGVGRS